MTDQNLEQAVAFLFSSLLFQIEELALKVEAQRQVLLESVIDPENRVADALRSVRTSDLAAKCKQIRLEAVQAVRDRDFDKLLQLAGTLSGTTLPLKKGEQA